MYAKVYKPTGFKLTTMKVITAFMGAWTVFCRPAADLLPTCFQSAALARLFPCTPLSIDAESLHTTLMFPRAPAGLIVVGALIGSARALVVEWSSGFTLFY